MIFLLALLPATMLTVAGYFVQYLANRSEGSFRTFGKYLSFWAFTLAALVVLGALFAAAHHHNMADRCPMHEHMHGYWHEGHRDDMDRHEVAPDAAGPRDGQPATAPPATPPAH